MKFKFTLVLPLIALGLLCAAPLVATARAGATWMAFDVPGTAPTRSEVKGNEISVDSDMGASFLFRELSGPESRARTLTWRWRVDMGIPATDLRTRGADDRDLALHIWFPSSEGPVNLLKNLKNAVISALGFPATGRTLTYVWGGLGKRFETFANPHNDPDGHMIILRPGGSDTGRWFSEHIDIAGDYQRLFGDPPPPARYIAVSSDTDDTGTACQGRLADLRFGA